MKKILLVIVLVVSSQFVISQVTYFNYLDTTATWYSTYGGWNGVQAFNSGTTTYFDGDTLINGNYYYKQYSISYDTVFSWNGTYIVDTVLRGPSFIREDNTLKFYHYSTYSNMEYVDWDWLAYKNLEINDTFPITGSNCIVDTIDSVYLGARLLERYHGSQTTFMPNYVLEGVGQIGPICALGIEANGWVVCFQKQNDLLTFSSFNLNAFPEPIKQSNTSTSVNDNFQTSFNICPNPMSDFLQVKGQTGALIKRVSISNASGNILIDKLFDSSDITINTSSLSKGVYLVHVVGDNINGEQKVIKY
ncbi:MAG: T9SS type A sorting domain-containing protein [Bacteroidota bacterium]